MANSSQNDITVIINLPAPTRLDKAITLSIPDNFGLSRSRIKNLMAEGLVRDKKGKKLFDSSEKSYKGQEIIVSNPSNESTFVVPEAIKLEVVFEDSQFLVINKPAGMIVHPAFSLNTGTLVNAILHHCGKNLSKIGGQKRPGIVHRIDKGTSGLLVVAKTDYAHQFLSKQFSQHSIYRRYLAVVFGAPNLANPRLRGLDGVTFESGKIIKISKNIARHKINRKKMSVVNNYGRNAVTRIRVKKIFGRKENPVASLVECWLETGRTHQIRVHMQYIGHGLIGDPVYCSKKRSVHMKPENFLPTIERLDRQLLHAQKLGFNDPQTGEFVLFSSVLPEDIKNFLIELSLFDDHIKTIEVKA
tara:strand:- start:126 stop:1202 length:1077 start_codon:yes stop_codon:yes gene_type:complete